MRDGNSQDAAFGGPTYLSFVSRSPAGSQDGRGGTDLMPLVGQGQRRKVTCSKCPEPSGPFPAGKLADVGEGSTHLTPSRKAGSHL